MGLESKLVSTYNGKGEEIPDPKPVALPVGFTRPLPLADRIRRLVQNELVQRELSDAGVESFDEADDFDVPEDPVDGSPYEENFDPLYTVAREQELRSGFVQERPAAAKVKAAETIAKHRKPAEPAKGA